MHSTPLLEKIDSITMLKDFSKRYYILTHTHTHTHTHTYIYIYIYI